MKTPAFNTTVLFYPNKNPRLRVLALWYFTILLIVWNVLGHTVLGFEQSWASPLVAIGTAIAMQMLLEWIDARAKNRELRFAGDDRDRGDGGMDRGAGGSDNASVPACEGVEPLGKAERHRERCGVPGIRARGVDNRTGAERKWRVFDGRLRTVWG